MILVIKCATLLLAVMPASGGAQKFPSEKPYIAFSWS